MAKTADKKPGDKPGQKVTIIFIVNGQDVEIDANVHTPLSAARDQALSKSNNTGRPPEEWEVRTEAGVLLDASLKIESFGFTSGVRLFLTLKVGAGGSSCASRLP